MAAQTAIRSYVIVVLGGLGSVKGALLGGLFLGIVEALTAGCYPDPSKGATYQVASGLLVFLVVLLCERLVVLDAGRVVADGEPDRVKRDGRVIAAYLGRGEGEAPHPAVVERPEPDDA
jgi:hypothetical protein